MRLALLVALVLAAIPLQAPYRIYLPVIGASPSPPRKGVAGSASVAQRREIGANWYHHWSLCNENEGPQCVDVSKGFWTWDDPPDGYGQGPDEIEAAMERCASGWFMFGDEWAYQDSQYCDDYPEWCWPMSRQVSEARWYIQTRDEVNPDCKLAFGGILTFHPSCRPMIVAENWVPEFYDAYIAEYGEAPDVQAVVLDDYYWDFWYYMVGLEPDDWETVTIGAVSAIRETYGPGVEVWAREAGSLMSHENALKAMGKLDAVTPMYDRYAWFISRADSGSMWEYTALWVDGELTDLGERYRDYKQPEPWGQ